jgi:hypothetical protein
MTDIETALRDEFRRVSRSVAASDQYLAGALTKSRRGRPRVTPALLVAGSVLAAVAVVAGFVALRSQQPHAVAVDHVAIDPSINLECDRRGVGADLAPSQQELASMSVVAMTVCKWTNPSTGDPRVDFESTLASETKVGQSAADELMAALTSADPLDPGSTCMMIDSPPPLTYNVRVQDKQGSLWGVSLASPSCLGFDLSGGRTYESGELLGLLGSLFQQG